MRTLATLGTAAFALATVIGAGMASADPAMPLSGSQETGPGDNNGHGFFTYDLDGTTFCYTLEWDRVDTAFAAHVHQGARHVSGGIVIPLEIGDGSGARVEACTEIDDALAAAITANPKAYYVNVHNEDFPAGAIRGQLK
ncbi:CHRD domain-containing protein [Phytoactinopolyspora alkaliphila]|uniref:CHRD domain-containing protein n=1 Tax=Phytoactinopolyspora alkaliphila TaxID=1783498 RepID=A0A6N9YIE4_9ACTN|nr:CHRD domain-containing protein [Phytoactinopolyspora alkaliphila]NED94734.1 CHRD domain-containing protein [Phytoactinopolyspora alkaliphila]